MPESVHSRRKNSCKDFYPSSVIRRLRIETLIWCILQLHQEKPSDKLAHQIRFPASEKVCIVSRSGAVGIFLAERRTARTALIIKHAQEMLIGKLCASLTCASR